MGAICRMGLCHPPWNLKEGHLWPAPRRTGCFGDVFWRALVSQLAICKLRTQVPLRTCRYGRYSIGSRKTWSCQHFSPRRYHFFPPRWRAKGWPSRRSMWSERYLIGRRSCFLMNPAFLPSPSDGGVYDGRWGQIALTHGLRARLWIIPQVSAQCLFVYWPYLFVSFDIFIYLNIYLCVCLVNFWFWFYNLVVIN